MPTRVEHYRTSHAFFERLVPHLASWPTRIDEWLDLLPAPSPEGRFVAHAPRRGVSWRESRRYGWPPRHFVGRARARMASHELIRGLRWTFEAVLRTGDLAMTGDMHVDAKVRDQLRGYPSRPVARQAISPHTRCSIPM